MKFTLRTTASLAAGLLVSLNTLASEYYDNKQRNAAIMDQVNAAYEKSKQQAQQGNKAFVWEAMPQTQAKPTPLNPLQPINPMDKIGGIKGIVFISFSMPDQAIRNYLMQASMINTGKTIKLAIRGLDESNSLIKTQQRISALMKGFAAEVDIDPGAFERFDVQTVPALVIYKDDPLDEAKCALEGKKIENDYVKVYGDVSLDYAIDHLLKDKKSLQWRKELTAMRTALIGKM